jgi:fructose-specific phosphotransferase system IIA component
MRLSDILSVSNIKVPLDAKTKADSIAELVGLLAASGEVSDPKRVLDAVMEREATRSTGIGNGLAIPHGKASGIDRLLMAIGKPAEPIDFNSVDGRPVKIIWLLASPADKTGDHIHALARISRLMSIDKFRKALLDAPTAAEMLDIIVKQESAL